MSDQAFDFDTSRERQQVEAFDRSIAQLEAHLQRLDRVGLGKLQGELHRLAGQGKTELEKLTAAAATEADKLRAVYGRGAGNQQWFSDVQKQKQAAVEALQHVKTEYATLLRHREQVAKAMVHQATKEATETLAVYSKLSTQTLNLVEVNQRRSQLRAKSASKMGLDDTRSLLGLPSRDEMKTLAASIKGQMQEALATSGLRAKSASKMGLDDTRSLLGLPSRDEMKTLAASIKGQMQEAVALESVKKKGRALGLDPSTVVGPFTAIPSLKPAAKDANELAGAFKLLSENGNNVHSMARGLASGFNALWLTWGALAPLFAGAAISNGFVQTAKSGMEVANTMKTIEVLGGNTAQQMSALNQEMLNIARTGPFGPKEIAESMKILSLAGLDANQILATTQDVLNFSVAGTTDLKTAADTLVSVSTAFGMGAEGFGRVGDVVAKAAAESKTSVESFSEAMKTASVIHKQYGVSLEDTATAIAAMSQLGIEGSAAGTALRNMYSDLSGRSEKVSAILKKQGIELREVSGEFRPLIQVVAELDQKFKSLKPIDAKNLMQDMLSERGGKAIIELLDMIQQKASTTGESFSSVLHEMQAKITDSYGFAAISAAQMAQTSQNMFKTVGSNLQASMLEAFAAMEPQLIVIADGLKKAFSSPEFVQGLTSLVSLVANFGAGLVSFTTFVIENTTAVLAAGAAYKLAQVYLASKAASIAAAATATAAGTAATVADTAATVANNAAKSGALGALAGFARFLPGIGVAVTVAAGAWSLYHMWQNRAKDTSLEAAGIIQNNVLNALNKEADALDKVNAKRAKGLTLSAATAEAQLESQMQEHMTPAKKVRADAEAKEAALVEKVNMLREKAASLGGKSSLANAKLSLAQAELAKASNQTKEAFDAETQALAAWNQAAQRVVTGKKFQADWQNEEQAAARKAAFSKHGTGTYDSEGAAFDRNTWQNIKVATDNTLQQLKARQTAVEAQLKSDYSNRKAILDSEHSAGLVSEGQYYARSLAMSIQHEDQMLANKRAAHEEYVKVAVSDYQKLQAKIDQVQATPAKGKASEQSKQQNLDKLVAMQVSLVEDISTSFTTLSTRSEELSSKLGTDLTVALNKSYGEVKKLTEAEADYWAKESETNKKEQAIAAISEQYRFAVDSVFSLGKAEEAAALTAASATEKHQQHLVTLNASYEDAAAAAEDLFHILTSNGDLSAADSQVLTAAFAKRDALRNLLADSERKAQEAVGDASAQAFAKVRKTQADQLSGDITNALVSGLINGGESAKNGLRDILVSELTKPVKMVVNVAVNAMLSSVMGNLGLSSAAGVASGVAGAASGAGGLSTVASGASLLGNSSFMMGLNGAWGAGGGMLSTLNAGASMLGQASSFMSGIGTIAGALAPIALGIGLLTSFIKKPTPHSGAGVTYSAAGGLTSGASQYNKTNYGFGAAGEYSAESNTAVASVAKGIATALDSTAVAFGKKAGFEISTAFADDKSKDGAWGQLAIKLGGQKVLDWRDTQTSKWAPKEFADGEAGLKEYQAAVAASMRDALSSLDLPGWVNSVLQDLGDAPALEDMEKALSSIAQANDAMAALGSQIGGLSGLSDEAKASLIDAFGGVETFAATASEYANVVLTDAEKVSLSMTDISSQFEALGMAVPSSVSALQDLISAQDLTTDAGREAVASLMTLGTSFATVMDQMQQSIGLTGDSLKSVFQNVLKEANSAEEAKILGEQAAGQLLMDAISNALVGTVTDLVSNAVLQPITQSIVGAAAQAATMDVAAASTAGATLAAGGAAGATTIAAGGAAGATSLAAGGAAGGANVAAGGAAAGQGLADIVGKAISVTNAMVDIMNNADFQTAFGNAVSAIGSISSTLFGGMTSIQTSMPGFAGGGSAAISSGGGGGGSSSLDNKNPLDDLLEERRKLEIELLKAQGQKQEALNRIRAKAIEGMSAEAVALYDANRALEEQIRVQLALNDFAKEGKQLQAELLKLQGSTAAAKDILRTLAIDGMSELEIAAYDANEALREQINTLQERQGLEERLANLLGNSAYLRERERAAISASNLALYDQVVAIEDAQTAAQDALNALKKAAQAEQERVRKQYEAESKTLQDSISAISDVVRDLDSALKSIRDTLDESTIQSQTAARLTLQSVLTAVQGGSSVSAFADVIKQSAGTLAKNDPQLYAQRDQYIKSQAQAAGLLGTLNEFGEGQLDTAERQLKTLEEWRDSELDRLDDMVTAAEKQYNAVMGIKDVTLSINEAVQGFDDAIAALGAAMAGAIAASKPSTGGNYGTIGNGGSLAVGDEVYAPGKGPNTKPGGGNEVLYNDRAAQEYLAWLQTPGAAEYDAWVRSGGKSFAGGGYYGGGLALVGERGPELINFDNPGMVYTAQQTGQILDNREVVAELRAVRRELADMKAETRRTADAVNGRPEQPMLVENVA